MPVPPPTAAQGAHHCLAGDVLCPDTRVGFYVRLQVQELTEVELGELDPHEFLCCVCQWLSQCQGLLLPGLYQDTKPYQRVIVSLWRAPDDTSRIQPVLSEMCPEKESPPFPHSPCACALPRMSLIPRPKPTFTAISHQASLPLSTAEMGQAWVRHPRAHTSCCHHCWHGPCCILCPRTPGVCTLWLFCQKRAWCQTPAAFLCLG